MNKHRITVKPINAVYGYVANHVLTGNMSEYTNSPGTRSIYFADPLKSLFKCKAISESPYLETCVFDLMPGDKITVAFDILKISNQAPQYFGVRFHTITGDTISSTYEARYMDEVQIDTFYKRVEFTFIVPQNYSSADGIMIAIRSVGNTQPCEYMLKDVNIDIETKNAKFKCNDNIVDYQYKKDFIKGIAFVGNTTTNTHINGADALITNGNITLYDNSVKFNTTNTVGKWKGLAGMLSSCKYSLPLVQYIEYKGSNNDNVGMYTQPMNNSDDWGGSTGFDEIRLGYLPYVGDWSNDMFSMQSKAKAGTRSQLMNLGRVGEEINVEIRRAIFCHPRYDAQPYFEPNDIFELYPKFAFNPTTTISDEPEVVEE